MSLVLILQSIVSSNTYRIEIITMSDINEKKSTLCLIISLICSIITVTVILYFISRTFHAEDISHKIKDLYVFSIDVFTPEPCERILFISGIMIFPICQILWYLFFSKLTFLNNLYANTINIIYTSLIFFCFFAISLLFIFAVIYTHDAYLIFSMHKNIIFFLLFFSLFLFVYIQ